MSLRIAVISTPRAGNTWLRLLLMDAYAIPGFAVHRPDDVNWADLPEQCVVQLHWRKTPELVHHLRERGFRVVSLARHPLDVLISILQFCWHDDSTLQWLDGEAGDERPIHGTMPGSAVFLEYAAGPRAAALMAVSREWAQAPECLPVRYEDLVADGIGEFKRITDALGESTRRPIAEVMAAATIPKLQDRTGVSHHFWQGRHGLWRSLLVGSAVQRIAATHSDYCAELGYSCDADPLLSAAQADANWLALIQPQVIAKLRAGHSLRQELADEREKLHSLAEDCAAKTRHIEAVTKSHEQLERDVAELTRGNTVLLKGYEELQQYCLSVERAYQEAAASLQATQAALQAMQATLQATQTTCKEYAEARLAEQERMRGLGPNSLAMARWLSGVSHRLPGTSSVIKKLLHLNQKKNLGAEKAG